ncbi:Nif11-like leader peptide family natural product precursor (plasmid) [Kovacikia minuta CCNUW1]|uniref:Nif11-like leader peptide family natural product precursor n=1 Tax=Kovacikia minuta TaxID=2931930 RepID=UPI001CCF3FE6|nr:Nif11-like leader peptide family natural product precursor [Kovacikia minuta]UBF30562.1 Nif11-like leader peptide family natural product precursor [Kovacikia minuta CCNUW1]
MAQQEVTRLFRAVQANSNLRDQLNEAPNLETFVQLAQGQGYRFTIEEWKVVTNFSVEELECELSEIPGI